MLILPVAGEGAAGARSAQAANVADDAAVTSTRGGRAAADAVEEATESTTSVSQALVRGPNGRAVFEGLEVRGMRDLSHVPESTLRAQSQIGFASRDARGRALVLHHHRQNPGGPIVEMPASNHSIGNVRQHPHGNTAGAGLTAEQRAAFNEWRVRYWRARARGELERRGLEVE